MESNKEDYMSIDIKLKGVQDVRWPIAGDSFFWEGIHPRDQVNRVTIHHSASDNVAFDAYAIASYHVNNLGWGGIGYHFVIKQDGTIQYAGDMDSWRAHVGNQNWGNIGICIMGDFTNHCPTTEQTTAVRNLLTYMFTQMPEYPNIVDFSQVKPHLFYNPTECPGKTWQQWWSLINPDYVPEAPPAHVQPLPDDPHPIEPEPEPEPIPEPQPEPTPNPPEKPEGGKMSLWEAIKTIIIKLWEMIWSKKQK